MPDELRRRLRPWVDVDEVGLSGFWIWLSTALPLLPPPPGPTRVTRDSAGISTRSEDRVRELARDLISCGADRAKLTITGQRYFADNQLLARRVKALESVLRTMRAAGHPVNIPLDEESDQAADRYLPRG